MSAALKRNEWIYATDAQEAYLRRLMAEAAPYRCAPYWLDPARRLLKSDASRAISDYQKAIAAAREAQP